MLQSCSKMLFEAVLVVPTKIRYMADRWALTCRQVPANTENENENTNWLTGVPLIQKY